KTLMEMGHGDEIVLADGNFPGASHTNNLIRCDGLMVPELLQDILKLFPLDVYVDSPVTLMEVTPGDPQPEIWDTYKKILDKSDETNTRIEYENRFSFYDRSKKAYAIVTTSEKSLYANVILKKALFNKERSVSMSGEVILEMQDIKKSFGVVRALKGANFKLKKGEVHALMGENGAGKSTMLKVLIGIYQIDAGKITFDGNEVI